MIRIFLFSLMFRFNDRFTIVSRNIFFRNSDLLSIQYHFSHIQIKILTLRFLQIGKTVQDRHGFHREASSSDFDTVKCYHIDFYNLISQTEKLYLLMEQKLQEFFLQLKSCTTVIYLVGLEMLQFESLYLKVFIIRPNQSKTFIGCLCYTVSRAATSIYLFYTIRTRGLQPSGYVFRILKTTNAGNTTQILPRGWLFPYKFAMCDVILFTKIIPN